MNKIQKWYSTANRSFIIYYLARQLYCGKSYTNEVRSSSFISYHYWLTVMTKWMQHTTMDQTPAWQRLSVMNLHGLKKAAWAEKKKNKCKVKLYENYTYLFFCLQTRDLVHCFKQTSDTMSQISPREINIFINILYPSLNDQLEDNLNIRTRNKTIYI